MSNDNTGTSPAGYRWRLLFGGGWSHDGDHCRPGRTLAGKRRSRYIDAGFRLVLRRVEAKSGHDGKRNHE